jgi:DnaJ-class molecular chaperone
VYKRDGDNLIRKHTVLISEALTGAIIDLVTLDDRKLKLAITEVIRFGF